MDDEQLPRWFFWTLIAAYIFIFILAVLHATGVIGG